MSFPSVKTMFPAWVMLGLAGAAAAQPAALRPPAQPPKPDPQLVARQYAEYSEIRALGERCKWFGALERQGLESTLHERKAWLVANGGDPGQAEAQARKRIEDAAGFPCTGPKADLRQHEIKRVVWQTTVTWTLRGEALLDGAGRPAWYRGQSKVAAQRAALERRTAELQAEFAKSLDPARPRIQAEAEKMLRLACRPQKDAKTACPEVPAEDAPLKDYARTWVAESEAFAAVLQTAPPLPTPSLDPPKSVHVEAKPQQK